MNHFLALIINMRLQIRHIKDGTALEPPTMEILRPRKILLRTLITKAWSRYSLVSLTKGWACFQRYPTSGSRDAHACNRTQTHTPANLTSTSPQPARPPAKHAQRLGFSYKPRCVRRPALARATIPRALPPTQWRASHKAAPHSRLFSHSILTARGSISGRMVSRRSQANRDNNIITYLQNNTFL